MNTPANPPKKCPAAHNAQPGQIPDTRRRETVLKLEATMSGHLGDLGRGTAQRLDHLVVLQHNIRRDAAPLPVVDTLLRARRIDTKEARKRGVSSSCIDDEFCGLCVH